MKDKIQINQVDPTTFEFQQYTEQDNILISSSRLDIIFFMVFDPPFRIGGNALGMRKDLTTNFVFLYTNIPNFSHIFLFFMI